MKALREKETQEKQPVTFYSHSGKGRAVILLHGYLESSEIWEGITRYLSENFHVIAPDLPGHGLSPVPGGIATLEAMARGVFNVIDGLGLERYTLVGHSMGGYVALAMAEMQPARLEGFCLFHSTPFADSPEKKVNRDRGMELIRHGKKQQLVGGHAPNTFSPVNEKVMADTVEDLKKMAIQTPDEGVIYALQAMKTRPDRREVLRELKVPLLLVHGLHDRLISGETFREIQHMVPEAQTLTLQHSGHMGILEETELSAKELGAFLSGIKD